MKLFGDMTADEKKALMCAWVDGITIEGRSDHAYSKWSPCDNPGWYVNFFYRVALDTPSIDWDHVAPEYKWLAVDKHGGAHLFSEKPYPYDCGWLKPADHTLRSPAESHSSLKLGNCNWVDSLVRRSK